MSALEWTRLPRHGDHAWEREYRRYCAGIGDNPDALRLERWGNERPVADWYWWVEHRELGYRVTIPGGDLPDAEAQRLAVPTLCAALRAVLADLDGA